jgi:broad specificity phosphatase PhoE
VIHLFLARHAATDGAFAGRCVGRLDVPLSELGREQAASLAASLPMTVTSVYASPLRRVLETAEPLAAVLGVALEVRHELSECDFGLLEGRSFAEIEATWPDVYATWMETPAAVRFPGGEAFADVRRRAAAFLAEIRTAAGEAALAVTHAGVIRAVLVETGSLDPGGAFALDVAHAAVIEVVLPAA